MTLGWHRVKFSCRKCSYSCDIVQDLEVEGENDDWVFPCLGICGITPVWKKTVVGKIEGLGKE